MTALDTHTALVVVDVQRDFCPGGALAVDDGDKVVAPLARYIELFVARDLPIVFTRDWHPEDHLSFESRGGPWPSHCVAGTSGAEFHPDLSLPDDALIISKATRPDQEAYSGFEGTPLEAELKSAGIHRVLVGGLATDYCVKATVLDAVRAGFETLVLTDACRAVNLQPDHGDRALGEMIAAGARPLSFEVLETES